MKTDAKMTPYSKRPEGLPVGRITWRRFCEKGWMARAKIERAIETRAILRIKGIGKGAEIRLRAWMGLGVLETRAQKVARQTSWPEGDTCSRCGSPATLIRPRGPRCAGCYWQERMEQDGQ